MGTIRVNCVIVNYHDAPATERLVRKIHDYPCLEHIVVVDNRSTDGSYERLQALRDEKVAVIRGEKNGGYGYGNNLGARYATEVNQATHVLIANPDVEFTNRCVARLASLFRNRPELGAASAVMEDLQCTGLGRGWRLHGFWGELLWMGPICRRLFGRLIQYPNGYFEGRKGVYVDVVHGSMLMVEGKAFWKCGGYDEGIFLYQEEATLAQRMKAHGYRTALLLTETFVHQHRAGVGASYEEQSRRQKLRQESVMYYMKHYLGISRAEEAAAKLWFGIILAEIWAASAAQSLYRVSWFPEFLRSPRRFPPA